jgi:hypothetical protein
MEKQGDARVINDAKIIAIVQRIIANGDAVDLSVPRNNIGVMFTRKGESWSRFCYTLEDEIRSEFVKIFGATCIEAGLYQMRVTYSPKFKRETVEITPLFKTSTKFTGLRVHGGNTEADSHGCILVAFNINPQKTRIFDSAERAFTQFVKERKGGILLVENKQLSSDGNFVDYLL